MAEEAQNTAASAAPEVVDVPPSAEPTPEKKEVAAPEPETTEESAPQPSASEEPAATTPAVDEAEEKDISQSASFKEETNVVGDLPEFQRKALDELKKLVQEALNNHEFTLPPPPPPPAAKEEEKKPEEEAPAAAAEEAPAVTEEKKDADPVESTTTTTTAPASAEEPPKTEETPVEKTEEEVKPAAAVEEEKKVEEEPSKPAEEEKAPAEEVVVEKATTITTTIDDDGAKTVEAIEESVVSVSSSTPAPEAPYEEEKKAEADDDDKDKAPADAPPPPPPEEVYLWGIPLLGDDRSDVILLKFLRARDFKVKETLAMIKKCVRWRKEFGVDDLLDEDLGTDYEKVVFAHGHDKQGRLVVYNVFGEFKDKDLYQLAFSDAEKQKKLLKWLVQFVERTVRKFDFSPNGINSFVLVNDLRNSPGYGKREFYKMIGKYLVLLQDNYPEFVSKQVCINVSFWYLAYSWVYVNVFTPRSKSKFVFASTAKTPETLFRYIAPEQVPVQYGGHSRADALEFTPEDAVSEVTVKPSSIHTLEFSFNEPCTFVWELRVVGWDVNYEAQFAPAEGYTVLVSKSKKLSATDEPIICDSFKVTEPGKLIISIDNHTSKKKKLLYRSKIKSSE